MKILIMLLVLYSDSAAFAYQMAHQVSLFYPLTYVAISVLFLSLPPFRH
jgi:hypothetical protein